MNSCLSSFKAKRERMHKPCTPNLDKEDVKEMFTTLEPSRTLLEHYRKKLSKFERDFEELSKALLRYKETASGFSLKPSERGEMTGELIELRTALSDVNVFLNAERQQVIKLHGQNERLKLDIMEAERKSSLLLSLCGLKEEQIRVFLKDSKKTSVIKQRLPSHLQVLKTKLKLSDLEETTEREKVLLDYIFSLEKQHESLESSWIQEKAVLLEDRRLALEEFHAQREKDEAYIAILLSKLHKAESDLHSATSSLIKKQSEFHEAEKKWLAERDNFLLLIDSLQSKTSFQDQLEAIQRSGSYTDLSEASKKLKSSCEARNLRHELETVKNQLVDAENLRDMYEKRYGQIEREKCKLIEQKESAEGLFKERSKNVHSKIQFLQKQYETSEERRKNQVISVISGTELANVDFTTLSDAKALAALVRGIQRGIENLRLKVIRFNCDISSEKSED